MTAEYNVTVKIVVKNAIISIDLILSKEEN